MRAAAVEALGRLASFPTMPSVANALVDPQPDRPARAAIAAGKFGVPALVIAAAQAVRDEPDLHGFVHEGVARTKAQVDAGSERVVAALIETSQWRDLHGWYGLHRRAMLDLSRSPRTSDRARARMQAILLVHRVLVGPEAVFLADDALGRETQLELIVGLGRSRAARRRADRAPSSATTTSASSTRRWWRSGASGTRPRGGTSWPSGTRGGAGCATGSAWRCGASPRWRARRR